MPDRDESRVQALPNADVCIIQSRLRAGYTRRGELHRATNVTVHCAWLHWHWHIAATYDALQFSSSKSNKSKDVN